MKKLLVKFNEEIIAQTQGTDDEVAEWLAGDSFKYPEGYQVEYIDITAEVEQEKINAEALAYLASTDWMIVREIETQVACPSDIKQLRAEARLKVVK
jgi:disulfide oxidoreductase YuzD